LGGGLAAEPPDNLVGAVTEKHSFSARREEFAVFKCQTSRFAGFFVKSRIFLTLTDFESRSA